MSTAAFERMVAERLVRTRTLRARLAQREVWTDREGREHRVATMDRQHAAGVVGFLERRARALHDGACAELVFLPEPNGEQAAWDLEDERTRLYWADPVEWLHEQPLVVALKARCDG